MKTKCFQSYLQYIKYSVYNIAWLLIYSWSIYISLLVTLLEQNLNKITVLEALKVDKFMYSNISMCAEWVRS